MFRTLLTISLLNTSFLFGSAYASLHKEEKSKKQIDEESSKEAVKQYNKQKAKDKIKEIEEVDEVM